LARTKVEKKKGKRSNGITIITIYKKYSFRRGGERIKINPICERRN